MLPLLLGPPSLVVEAQLKRQSREEAGTLCLREVKSQQKTVIMDKFELKHTAMCTYLRVYAYVCLQECEFVYSIYSMYDLTSWHLLDRGHFVVLTVQYHPQQGHELKSKPLKQTTCRDHVNHRNRRK